jgi:hypothetical protein
LRIANPRWFHLWTKHAEGGFIFNENMMLSLLLCGCQIASLRAIAPHIRDGL